MDTNMESTDTDLGKLLAYGDLGPLSVGDISVEAMSSETDTESFFNDKYHFGNALMGEKYHHNSPDPIIARLHTRATFSDSNNEKVRNVGKKREENMVCRGSAYGKSFASIQSSSVQSVFQSGNLEHSFINSTGRKSFQCGMCLKQFRTSKGCQRHRRIHAEEKPSSDDYQKQRRTPIVKKLLQCEICPKQFGTSSDYKKHQRIHSGEKPFQCDICSKQFFTPTHYKIHRRTHTGEKPFQCDICAKKFHTSSNCNAHRRTHTGEKPFQCDVCPKKFYISSNCNAHREHIPKKNHFIVIYARNSFVPLAVARHIDVLIPQKSHSNVIFAVKNSATPAPAADIDEYIPEISHFSVICAREGSVPLRHTRSINKHTLVTCPISVIGAIRTIAQSAI